MELARNDVLEGEFGTPGDGARPLLRVTAHVRTATFRWIGAAIGGYHDGENALADQLEDSFRPGMLNLADRGFFSMHRWIPVLRRRARSWPWRVKNGAIQSVPARTLDTLPDGSELSPSCTNRAACAPGGGRMRPRLPARAAPERVARLVTFTVTTVTAGGEEKTAGCGS